VEALGEALRHWGDDFGAVVVVSHDRVFCSQLEFTHVATVADGKLIMEQRDARESDWVVGSTTSPSKAMDAQASSAPSSGSAANCHSSSTTPAKPVVSDPVLRKKLFNAPKRIQKIEEQVAKLEKEVTRADEAMLSTGNDLDKLNILQQQKDSASGKIDALMKEWDELESLLEEYR
jgi:ATP-binding cassette subfamily F protein uup